MGLPGLGLILKTISFLLASWLVVHLLAVFGVFLVIAYPIWWLFFPKKTICFYCRIKNEGEFCPFCRRRIDKANGIFPETLRSAVFNGGLILIFSLFSIGFVFTESRVLNLLGFPPTPKTVSFVIPTTGQYRLGQVFPMKIEITGIKKPINIIQADISFDPKILEVREISTNDSFANIFVQKEINNQVGFARLAGGLPNPGFSGERGIFGTVYFKGKSPGVVKVDFSSSSKVLANDGRGSNTLKDLASVSYLILPEEISETEKEEQETILQPGVLGEFSGEETQMEFYEEEKILGAQIDQEIEKEKKFNLGKILPELLERADRAILFFWGKIFSK